MINSKKGVVDYYIILLAVGLIAFIVVIVLFSDKVKIFTKSTNCASQGGECLYTSNNNNAEKKCGEGDFSNLPGKISSKDCGSISNGQYKANDYGPCCIPIG